MGQCNSQEEFNELCRIHESLKVGYAFTLYDSRCILFGLNPDGTLYEEGSHSSDVSPCIEPDDEGHPGPSKGRIVDETDSGKHSGSDLARPDSLLSESNSLTSSMQSSVSFN